MMQKELGDVAIDNKDVSEEIIFRIEIPANRYDLLCLEGLAAGLLVFQNLTKQPTYEVSKIREPQTLTITPSTSQIRPFAVAAVLRDIVFTKDSYAGFIDLQVSFEFIFL